MKYHVPLDRISDDLMDDLREQFARCEVPDWLRPTGLKEGDSPEEVLRSVKEDGIGVAPFAILESAPDEIHEAVEAFEPPAEHENAEFKFFRGFEVSVSYRQDSGDVDEVKVSGVYQD